MNYLPLAFTGYLPRNQRPPETSKSNQWFRVTKEGNQTIKTVGFAKPVKVTSFTGYRISTHIVWNDGNQPKPNGHDHCLFTGRCRRCGQTSDHCGSYAAPCPDGGVGGDRRSLPVQRHGGGQRGGRSWCMGYRWDEEGLLGRWVLWPRPGCHGSLCVSRCFFMQRFSNP